MKNIDIDKIVVCNKVSFGKKGLNISFGKKGFKYFIGYKDAEKIRTLSIFLPKMSACRRDFDETKYRSFLIKDDELFENVMKIGKKLKIVSKKNLMLNLCTMKNI